MKKFLLSTLVLSGMLSTAIANNGGPDSYGYTYKDSFEPGGPVYNWIEIATPAGGSGTLNTNLQCDDCHDPNIALGFNFDFYGTVFNAVSIASNGTVYFEDTYLGLSNNCMPGTPSYTMTTYNFIAHMWGDLDPSSQGGVYTQAFANYFVIEFYDVVPCCGAGDGDTWEIILFSNGNILIQYKELSNIDTYQNSVVGIQNDPTTGLQYTCNDSPLSLSNTLAVLFTHPGSECPSSQQDILGLNPGYCQGGSVTFDAPANAISTTWSDASTGSSLVVNAAGTISISTLMDDGCSVYDDATVTEFSNPTVTWTLPFTTTCVNYVPFGLTGENPTGGDFTGTGVAGGVFDPSVAGLGTYTLTYTYIDGNGCSGTATQDLIVDACTGVDEIGLEGVIMYPNPSNGYVSIDAKSVSVSMNIEIINQIGSVVYRGSLQAGMVNKLDVSSFANGVYYVKISNSNAITTNKLILQK